MVTAYLKSLLEIIDFTKFGPVENPETETSLVIVWPKRLNKLQLEFYEQCLADPFLFCCDRIFLAIHYNAKAKDDFWVNSFMLTRLVSRFPRISKSKALKMDLQRESFTLASGLQDLRESSSYCRIVS